MIKIHTYYFWHIAGGWIPNFNAFFTKCFITFHPTAIFLFLLHSYYMSIGNFSIMFRKTSVNLDWYSFFDLRRIIYNFAYYFSFIVFRNAYYCFYLYCFIYYLIYRHFDWRMLTSSINFNLASFLVEFILSSCDTIVILSAFISASLFTLSYSRSFNSFYKIMILSFNDKFSCYKISI